MYKKIVSISINLQGKNKIVNMSTKRWQCKNIEFNSENAVGLLHPFLASQDALEVMGVSEWLSHSWLANLTDVTPVTDDTYVEDEEGE